MLLSILKQTGANITWIEDLCHIGDFKYTVGKVKYLDDAFLIAEYFQLINPIKEMKVNLHLKSAKIWKQKEEDTGFASIISG